MDTADPDVPAHKRARLDSVNPPYSGLPPPPHAPPGQPTRHPVQSSSPASRHPHPHGLPHPSPQYPPQGPSQGQGHYQPHQPPPPPADLRTFSDPTLRPVPSPHQRSHSHGFPVTLPALPPSIDQDRISDYARPSGTPRSSAPEPQSSRPATIDTKPQPGMEHGGHASPWPPNPEHRPNGAYMNGYPRVVSPQQHQEQQFQTPPLPAGQQYAPPPVPVYAGTPGPYMGGSAAYASQSMRRKQVRATQACNHCRARKQKCDEARPCQFCRENNFDCQYKEVPPPKQDKSMMQLQHSVNEIADSLKTFINQMSVWKQDVDNRLNSSRIGEPPMLAQNRPSPDQNYGSGSTLSDHGESRIPTPQGRGQFGRMNSMKTESPLVHHSAISPFAGHASTPIKQEAASVAHQPPATPAGSSVTDSTSQSDDRQRTGLQGDHTTPAHQVLQDWPRMDTFWQGVEVITKLKEQEFQIADYPMKLEQARGLLRVWGVGEGPDMNDGTQGPSSPESHISDTPSPPAAGMSVWGKMEASSPSTMGADTPQDTDHVGGLGPDGQLKLDEETLWRLHQSYHRNIHSLHPFLNPSELRRMIKHFGQMYGPESRRSQALAGNKRKRTGGAYGDYSASRGGEVIDRSLHNAIVLLVLALGKVCEWKKPLPAPQADRNSIENSLWGFRRASSRSVNNSFSSDYEGETRLRNIDILPGMAYFSYATDILGNQQGGNTTGHAQAMLLAGLYIGQFARVLESWSWIHNACRVCTVLIKAEMPQICRPGTNVDKDSEKKEPPKPEKVMTEKDKFKLDLIKCVYWTCLQLETDILAEMSTLPPSRISEYQETVAYPSGVFETFPDGAQYDERSEHDKTMWIYSSLIHLRVILNEAHNTLYNTGSATKPKKWNLDNLNDIANTARVHADILLAWRQLLPPQLAWKDEDPPSTNINIARLRAKFYGGYYMILRPFLFIALHRIQLPPRPATSGRASHTNSPAALSDTTVTSPNSDAQRSEQIMELNEEQRGVLLVALKCIDSAIQSTIAFDRVGENPNSYYREFIDIPKERIIVTNILGTLHAQFGNMIVLGAVWQSSLSKHLGNNTKLTKRNLGLLFKRTITMLRQVGDNSPILTVDADILENAAKVLHLDLS